MRKYNYNRSPKDNNDEVYSKTQIPYLPILGTKSLKKYYNIFMMLQLVRLQLQNSMQDY